MRGETTAEEEEVWRELLTTDKGHTWAVARRMFRVLPSSPRCKMCNSPFRGPGGVLMHLAGRYPAPMNPNFCAWCARWAEKHPGGAEIQLAMLFADVRNSTPLARSLGDAGFTQIINRFYVTASDVLIQQDALISRMVGDEVVALFLPVILKDRYATAAVEAARSLLRATGHDDPQGPWLPIGVGVHAGSAYVGMWGTANGVQDFTALGSEVSLTARLAQVATAGEILMTEGTRAAAGVESGDVAQKRVDLKGWGGPMDMWSMSMLPAAAPTA